MTVPAATPSGFLGSWAIEAAANAAHATYRVAVVEIHRFISYVPVKRSRKISLPATMLTNTKNVNQLTAFQEENLSVPRVGPSLIRST